MNHDVEQQESVQIFFDLYKNIPEFLIFNPVTKFVIGTATRRMPLDKNHQQNILPIVTIAKLSQLNQITDIISSINKTYSNILAAEILHHKRYNYNYIQILLRKTKIMNNNNQILFNGSITDSPNINIYKLISDNDEQFINEWSKQIKSPIDSIFMNQRNRVMFCYLNNKTNEFILSIQNRSTKHLIIPNFGTNTTIEIDDINENSELDFNIIRAIWPELDMTIGFNQTYWLSINHEFKLNNEKIKYIEIIKNTPENDENDNENIITIRPFAIKEDE